MSEVTVTVKKQPWELFLEREQEKGNMTTTECAAERKILADFHAFLESLVPEHGKCFVCDRYKQKEKPAKGGEAK